ncbi:TetR/AcrR family transcriptional regulator [Ruegeria meonggei]|uniref:TetR/AcrR family transcriptional regulator n=1 Tax=Ruegeria meonggei TaxID=1446476 RepID=UPI0036730F21
MLEAKSPERTDAPQQIYRKPTRANGRQTYEKLLDVLEQNLPLRAEAAISLKDLAKLTDVPTASAYHFFSSPDGAVAALAERYVEKFADRLGPQESDRGFDDIWDLVGAKIDLARVIYETHPAALKIFYGPSQSSEVRRLAIQAQQEGAREVLATMSRYFEIPDTHKILDKFSLAAALNDSIWAISFIRHGCITDELAEEGKRAVRAYISAYIGTYHRRRFAP